MQFKKYVPRYQELCRQYHGEEVSCQDALDGVIGLFDFARAVTNPISKAEDKK